MPDSRLATFFHWRIDPAQRDAFVAAWAEVTHALKRHGSHGSALFERGDGSLCAFARWPDAQTRDRAFADVDAATARRTMRDAIVEELARMDMAALCDLWGAAQDEEQANHA
tara:strand:+ start:1665 stop:2000 length:336 start_codon:yes stop_codon:yes gene_type:complete